jgi:enoyl-CoA hydratase/carnithine racemase
MAEASDVGQSDPFAVETNGVEVTRPRDGVTLVTIASEPLGVLRVSVKRALSEALAALEADETARCVVLTGTGRAFSVGSDIRDFSQDAAWLKEAEIVERDLNAQIENLRMPVIAACNGFTLGGGAVLTLACDIRFAAESAKFGFPEVTVGAFASGSGTQRLPRIVGRGRALELLLTGRTIDAAEAFSIQLIEEIVPDDELIERALDLAESIASMPASVIEATKQCVNVGLKDGVAAGLALEMALRIATGMGPDAEEGRSAFLEKRPPRYNT